jgi:predicted nuclease with TOPRIM domain
MVENDDVTVERRIHPSGANEAFVTIAVRNTTDRDLSIRIDERVSDSVETATPIDSLDQDSSSWRFHGDRICHEYDVSAADNRAIIYELEVSEGSPETELSRPSIVDVTEVGGNLDDGAPGEASDGDGSNRPLWRGAASAADSTPDADDAASAPPVSKDAETQSLFDQFVTAVESADPDELERLRELIRPGQSERVRLNHFRSRVDDMEAYGAVMESFLDEYGRPEDVVDEIDDRIGEIAGRLDDVDDRIDEIADRLDDRHDEVDGRLDEMEEGLRARRTEIEQVEDAARERQRLFEVTAEQFEDEFERLDREFAELREQVEAWHDTQNQIAAALSGERVDDDPDA